MNALNRYDEALASFDRALTLRPDLVEALTNRVQHLGVPIGDHPANGGGEAVGHDDAGVPAARVLVEEGRQLDAARREPDEASPVHGRLRCQRTLSSSQRSPKRAMWR